MNAIVAIPDKEKPSLNWMEVPDVHCTDDEVLVDVMATAVNRADLLQARGLYPPPPGESTILGLEMAGVIVETGKSVRYWQPGDRVISLLAGGGYAERVSVHKDMLIKLPDDWAFTAGAAIPEVCLTAFVNLFLEGELKPGETVLIHAGASGVGTAGIQMARENKSRVYVTAGTEEKISYCRDLGAEVAINYKEKDFLEVILDETNGEGVDLILDPVGASYFERNIRLLKEYGRLVNIGLLGGTSAALDMGSVLMKSIRIIGSRLRSRSLKEKIEITRQFKNQFWEGFEKGALKPVIDRIFPIQEAQKAHQYVSRNRNIGKVILVVDPI